MLELIINKKENLENIILLQNGKIIEYYTSTEEDKKRRIEGNIYVGKVGDIINGMQAAFVDFGSDKKGFIHLKDALPQVDERKEKICQKRKRRKITSFSLFYNKYYACNKINCLKII